MIKSKFILINKKSKNPELIYLYTRIKGKKFYFSVQEKVRPADWLESDGRVKSDNRIKRHTVINNEITKVKKAFQLTIEELEEKGFDVTADAVKSLMEVKLGRKDRTEIKGMSSMWDYFDKFALNMLKERGYESARQFTQATRNLKDFNKDLTWADINKECYEEFIEYLEETGISKNTIGKHIRHIRIMLNASVKEGEQSVSDHTHWRALKEISDTTYLTIPEIEKLYAFKPEMVFHERAKDLFIIGCWTGLRVSNLLKINPKTDLSPDEKKLYIHAVKGGDKVLHIPVHPMVLEIFKKYNYELPKMSYAYFFDRAREVIKAAGFTEPFKFKRTVGGKLTEFTVPRCDAIGTHTMRRSFATNMYKIQVPKKIIMDITGHKKEDTFMKYIRISQEESADYLSGVFDQMSSGK